MEAQKKATEVLEVLKVKYTQLVCCSDVIAPVEKMNSAARYPHQFVVLILCRLQLMTEKPKTSWFYCWDSPSLISSKQSDNTDKWVRRNTGKNFLLELFSFFRILHLDSVCGVCGNFCSAIFASYILVWHIFCSSFVLHAAHAGPERHGKRQNWREDAIRSTIGSLSHCSARNWQRRYRSGGTGKKRSIQKVGLRKK